MRLVLDDHAAIYTWLLVTVAGVLGIVIVGQSILFVVGFVLGGSDAFALVDVKARLRR
jgi:hypothetical protein